VACGELTNATTLLTPMPREVHQRASILSVTHVFYNYGHNYKSQAFAYDHEHDIPNFTIEETPVRIKLDQVRENREKIVAAAATQFRQNGFDGIGVAKLMQAAGFTVGGFYNHFSSKDELMTEAVVAGFNEIEERYRSCGASGLIDNYISKAHRDAPGEGCPAAALAAEASRHSEETRGAFEDGIKILLKILQSDWCQSTGDRRSIPRGTAIALLAQAVGAIALARSCPDGSTLADEILDTCRTDGVERVRSTQDTQAPRTARPRMSK